MEFEVHLLSIRTYAYLLDGVIFERMPSLSCAFGAYAFIVETLTEMLTVKRNKPGIKFQKFL